MGRRVPPRVWKYVVLVVTIAILAAPLAFIAIGVEVLAAENSEHSCGGG